MSSPRLISLQYQHNLKRYPLLPTQFILKFPKVISMSVSRGKWRLWLCGNLSRTGKLTSFNILQQPVNPTAGNVNYIKWTHVRATRNSIIKVGQHGETSWLRKVWRQEPANMIRPSNKQTNKLTNSLSLEFLASSLLSISVPPPSSSFRWLSFCSVSVYLLVGFYYSLPSCSVIHVFFPLITYFPLARRKGTTWKTEV
jgi:hypothetical protein